MARDTAEENMETDGENGDLPMNHFSGEKSKRSPCQELPQPATPKKSLPPMHMFADLVHLPKRPDDGPVNTLRLDKPRNQNIAALLQASGPSALAAPRLSVGTAPELMSSISASRQPSAMMSTDNMGEASASGFNARASSQKLSNLSTKYEPIKKHPLPGNEDSTRAPPSGLRMVKPRHNESGQQQPRPASSMMVDVSIVPMLRTQYSSIEQKIADVDLELFRLPVVNAAWLDMRAAAFCGNIGAFTEALELVRGALEWPDLG